ncbi:hypothetical protein ACFQXB_14000 [Plastorhodobacter daqingensis]|uniref:Lipoprotein n=1 Tax=Plastorhodobacter daqingensis TaxID=1387281 RepID=A0ABW2UMW1_9RHOB
MSKTTKVVLALSLVAFVSACNRQPEPQPVAAAPIAAEPTFTGKYR